MTAGETGRVDWVDAAKGICIIFVVMMHSTLGVQKAAGETGWMGHLVEFARPFRMPDFFMISGLFLAQVIDRPWRRYLDRKVVHFLYFYVLWLTIQFVFKAPGMAAESGWQAPLSEYLLAYVQPFGTLWFIYMLPVMFVVTRALREARVPWQATLAVAALLHVAPIHTGSVLIDEFCSRYVFFFSGYVFAERAFALAAWARAHPGPGLAGLGLWALVNGMLVFLGLADLPLVNLVLGTLGALAVIVTAALLTESGLSRPFVHCGQNSIVIYLAFFLPMAVTRTVLLRTGIIPDIGTISVLVTVAGVIGPLIVFEFVRRSGHGWFLFRRPAWARLEPETRRRAPQAAE